MTATALTHTSAELRERCLELGDKVRELREAPASKRDDAWMKDLRTATAELAATDMEFSIRHRMEDYDMRSAAWDAIVEAEKRKPDPAEGGAGTRNVTGEEARTFGEMFVASDAYTEQRTGPRSGEFTLPEGRSLLGVIGEQRTLLTSSEDDGAAGGLFVPRGSPFLANVRRQRLFVRDLIPATPTNLNSVPYIRELSPAVNEGGASAVSEGSAKPEVTMQFEEADAPVRKIAAWIPVTNEVIDDAPTLRGYIDGRLLYMLALREEQQILAGTGTAPQLKGILDYTGGTLNIQTQAFSADAITTVGLAAGKIEVVDGYADGIAINPTDYWALITDRHSEQFDAGFSTGLPFGGPPTTLWGLPAVRTRAMTAGTAIVGAWALGAQIFDRLAATIKTTDSHDDYFIYNKTVILAEERVAFAVHRPDFFVSTDLTA